MKHTGKILFGVLSTSALVGTGFAAWIVNNGFTDTKTVVVDSSVDTDVENKYSSVVDLTVDAEKDNTLRFASKENGEDLSLTYYLKANEAAYTTDFSLVTNEYIPDITVTLSVTSKTGQADITTKVKEYLVLPEEKTIAYDAWLQEEYKEAGYPLNIDFKWNTDAEGTNPQDWVIDSGKSPQQQRDYFTSLVSTLSDAKFTFTFTIGRTVEMTTFTVNENLVNGKLTFKDSSGNTLNPGTSYRVGTEVEVVPEANPYYKVDKVLVDEVEVTANEEGKYLFTLDKASSVSATFVNKVNTVTLTYEETQGKVKLTNVLGEDLVGTTLNANDTFKVVATPNENYVLKGVVVTQGEETLIDVEGVYTVLDNEDGINVTVTFEIRTATVNYQPVTGISNVKLNNVAINEVTTLDYGTEVTITFDVNEGYELTNVLLDGETLVATEEAYKFTVSKETYTLSFEVGVAEVTYEDVATILAKDDGEVVKFRGKVVADTTRGPLVLDENGQYVYVYGSDLTGTYYVGDLVKVSGELSTYKNLREVINPTIEVFTDDSLVINDLEAVTLNYDDINADMSGFVKYKFDCRASKGNYINLYIDGGEDKNVSLNNLSSEFTFEDGKYYSVEGYFAKSGSNYVSITASNVTELKTVTVTDFTFNEISSINVGQSVTLSIKDVKPTFYKETVTPTFEIEGDEGYVRIDEGNKLVGVQAGTGLNIVVKATVGRITKSFEINSVSDMQTISKTYIHTFASKQITTAGGTATLSGLEWTYSSADYIGFEGGTDGRGLQIGSSKKPSSSYSFTTVLPEGVIVNKVKLVLSTGGSAEYQVVTGTFDSNKQTISSTKNQEYIADIAGSDTNLTINMFSTKAAMYIKSMTIEFSVPTDVDFLTNL